MPSLLTPRTRFLHVPKTGGTWVSEALEAAGVPCQPLWTRFGAGRRGHADLELTAAYADRFTLAFVRHPLDCYRSTWGHVRRAGWPSGVALFDTPIGDFSEFVKRMVRTRPGMLSSDFTRFTGPPDSPISFVGRFESLVDDLVRALTEAGEDFDEAALRAHRKANVTDYQRFPAEYDVALAELVLASEHEVISRWYADDPLPTRFLNRGDRALVARSAPGPSA